MITENLDVFFIDWGEPVLYKTSSFLGIYEAASDLVGDLNISTARTLLVKSSDAGLMMGGDTLNFRGVVYKVKTVRQLDDGAFSLIQLGQGS